MLSASGLQISSRFVTVCPFTARQLRLFPTTQDVGRPAHYLFIYREIPCRSIAGWCQISMKCVESWNSTPVYMCWPQQMVCLSCKMTKEGRGGHHLYTSITIYIVENSRREVVPWLPRLSPRPSRRSRTGRPVAAARRWARSQPPCCGPPADAHRPAKSCWYRHPPLSPLPGGGSACPTDCVGAGGR